MNKKKPNILIIMPDEMRADCLSLEKHPVLKTPNIDSIGQGGMHFTSGYSTCPSCIAARRSMLTGLYPASNGVVGYKEGVAITMPTVTECLRDDGYATSIAGRYMHQSPPEEPYGFQKRVLGSTYIRDDAYAQYLNEKAPDLGGISGIGMDCNGREGRAWPVDDELHPTSWAIRQSQKIVGDADDDKPFFHVSSYYSPHSPLFPPKRHMDHFLSMELPATAIGEWETPPSPESYENNISAPRVNLQGEELRQTQSGYFGLIRQIDEEIAALLNDFKKKSESMGRPWVIVFTSDHGEMLGDHYLFRKCEPYDGSARIPFLIQGSDDLNFNTGGACNSPVCLEDIMPTLLDLAQIKSPDNLDGQSLVPVLRGKTDAVRELLHAEHAPCYGEAQAFHLLTDGNLKYIWRPADGTEQLFDLKKDPRELNNLAAGESPEVESLIAPWRTLMVQQLKERPEGFSDGDQLIAGRAYAHVLPSVEVNKS